jgi:hypothetical protein
MDPRHAEFEYQEMKVLLDALQREQIVSSKRMDPAKATELNRYIERVVASTGRRKSLSPDELRNTTWNLVYTTMEALPPDSSIQFFFKSVNTIPTENDVDGIQYRLVFGSKTFGLNGINVHGDWTLLPGQDSIYITYQTLSMDAFGRENIHLCLLQNLLRGRTNQIDTAFYDGSVWIEQQDQPNTGAAATTTSAKPIWNVYVKDEKEDASYLRY